MKKIKTILIACTLFLCAQFSFAETPKQTDSVKVAAKAEVQQFIDMIKPLVDQAAASNGTKIPFENIIWFLISLISVAVIMYFHRVDLKKRDAAHAALLKSQNDAHAETIKNIVSKP